MRSFIKQRLQRLQRSICTLWQKVKTVCCDRRWRRIWPRTVTLLLAGIFLALAVVDGYAGKVEADMKESVVRLHIVANSDSAYDQGLKLKVRDRIVHETGDLFEGADFAQSKQIVADNLARFEQIARDELQKNGCEDTVTASFGIQYFPTKTYQDLSFPAGNYTALKLVIGEGKGQNWWCVLFPPLCFVGTAEPYMDEDSREQLRASLPEEEYELVTESDSELPVQFKFKVVEWWQAAKNRWMQ